MDKKQIYRKRAENYAWFYAERQRFLSLSEDEQLFIQRITEHLELPVLNEYGGMDGDPFNDCMNLVLENHLEISLLPLLHPFICTESGWLAYVELHQNLPEVVPTCRLVRVPASVN